MREELRVHRKTIEAVEEMPGRRIVPEVEQMMVDVECQRWLRDYLIRAMLGVPQLAYNVTRVDRKGSATTPGKTDKSCLLQ